MVVIEEFKPVLKNTLRGFATVRHASGLRIHEVALHVSHGRAWASPPSRQKVDSKSGTVLRDQDGKPRWETLIEFTDKGRRDAWSAEVVTAVHEAHPDALQGLVQEDAL